MVIHDANVMSLDRAGVAGFAEPQSCGSGHSGCETYAVHVVRALDGKESDVFNLKR